METFIVLRFIVQKLSTTLLGEAVEDADRCFLQQSLAACLEKSHWQGETGKWGAGPRLLWAFVPLGFMAEAGFTRSKAVSAQVPGILTLSFVSLTGPALRPSHQLPAKLRCPLSSV